MMKFLVIQYIYIYIYMRMWVSNVLAVSRLADLDCSLRFSRLLIITAVILVDGCAVPARRNKGQLF
jgi:hypothetical protein